MKMKNIKGLVLMEALMAIALLSIATTVMGGIVRDSISTTTLSKDYLSAHNLSIEAMESMKNIRDTNWLIHPSDKNCWLAIDPTAANVVCPADQMSVGVNYVTARTDNGSFKLTTVAGQNLDLEKNPKDKGPYKVAGDFGGADFYRSVKLLGVTKAGASVKSASFEVRVEWERGKKNSKLVRNFVLYNYIK